MTVHNNVLILIFAVILMGCKDEMATNHTTKPNIIFIYADDLGWSDLGCYGNTYHSTPNIDRLSNQGITYTNAYAPAPVCSPARAGVFSGQYPARLGLTDWIPGHWRPYEKKLAVINRTQYLPLEVTTLGEAMQQAGYTTGYFGKWHLGYDDKYAVENQGFDQVVRFSKGGTYWKLQNRLFPPQPQLADSAYLTDVLTDFAVDFLERNQDSTFMLVVSHFAVHLPLEVPDSILNNYLSKPKTEEVNNPWYAAMLASLDNNVGRLLKKVDELGLAENTLIVFYSDNGGLYTPYKREYLKYTRNQPVTSNAPLRGEKGNLYEGGIRVPLIVRWPNHIEAASVSNGIVNGIDFFPTFLDLAGVNNLGELKLDGESIVETFKDPSALSHRTTFWHYPVYHHDSPASAVRHGNYKLIKHYLENSYELYDLSVDIGETNDLSTKYPEKLNEMIRLLENHLNGVNADLPELNPKFSPELRTEWGPHPDSNN